MKTILTSLPLLGVLALTLTLTPGFAAEKKPAGPHGGRVIRTVEPALEFYVTKDRAVEITALTPEGQPARLSGQVIAVTAGERSHPVKLEFREEEGRLLSTTPLPAGEGYPVSVSIKPSAAGKATYDRFNLELEKCPTCAYPEYACVCTHAGQEK